METPIESNTTNTTTTTNPADNTATELATAPAPEPSAAAQAPELPAEIAATNLLDLIAAAEERGYRRGIDEAGRKAIADATGLWSAPAAQAQEMTYNTGSEILRTVRPGVWDR